MSSRRGRTLLFNGLQRTRPFVPRVDGQQQFATEEAQADYFRIAGGFVCGGKPGRASCQPCTIDVPVPWDNKVVGGSQSYGKPKRRDQKLQDNINEILDQTKTVREAGIKAVTHDNGRCSDCSSSFRRQKLRTMPTAMCPASKGNINLSLPKVETNFMVLHLYSRQTTTGMDAFSSSAAAQA